MANENEIREAAYYIWLNNGCPEGVEIDCWLEAEACECNEGVCPCCGKSPCECGPDCECRKEGGPCECKCEKEEKKPAKKAAAKKTAVKAEKEEKKPAAKKTTAKKVAAKK